MNNQSGRIILDRLMTPPVGATNWLWVSLLVLGVDQLSKYYINETLDLFDRVRVFALLDITHLQNKGAAFSFLSNAGGWQRWLFITLGLVVSIAIVVWLRRLPRRGQTWLAIALALIVGGALGNVVDRALYGHVIDFISFHYADWYFPAFNLADSCITAGAAMLIIDSLFLERRRAARLTAQASGLKTRDSAKRNAGSGKREVRGSRAPGSGDRKKAQPSGLKTRQTPRKKKPAAKKKTAKKRPDKKATKPRS